MFKIDIAQNKMQLYCFVCLKESNTTDMIKAATSQANVKIFAKLRKYLDTKWKAADLRKTQT